MRKISIMNGIDLTIAELVDLKHLIAVSNKQYHYAKNLNAGQKRSVIKGRGIDFDEVREYQLGDDVRNIDWRVSARSQKTYTKIYKEEKQRPILLAVNLTTSMHFATKCAFKSVIAAHVATLLAWFAHSHKDKIGAVINNGKAHLEVKPSYGKASVQKIIKALHQLHQNHTWSDDTLTDALLRMNKVAHPGSLAIIIDDFQQYSLKQEKLCQELARHNELVFIFIYDPCERFAPKANQYLISDGTDTQTLDTSHKKTRQRHEQMFKQRMARVQSIAQKFGKPFICISTTDNLFDKLSQHLSFFIK